MTGGEFFFAVQVNEIENVLEVTEQDAEVTVTPDFLAVGLPP